MSVISCENCGRYNRKRQKCSLIHGCFQFRGWRPSPKLQNKLNKLTDLENELQQYKNLFKTFREFLRVNK